MFHGVQMLVVKFNGIGMPTYYWACPGGNANDVPTVMECCGMEHIVIEQVQPMDVDSSQDVL